MILRLAQYDPLKTDEVHRTVRVRDGLAAYLELVRVEAAHSYRHDQMLFVQGGLKKAPRMPGVLQSAPRKRAPGEAFVEPPKPAFLTRMEEEGK